MSYDSRCYDLAEIFLGDVPVINTKEKRRELAQEIQNAIEGWLSEQEDTADRVARVTRP